MGDRTKIADALDDSAATIRGVGMWQERNGDVMSTLPSIADLMERAAGLLRADPDTSDERLPCPHCNDEGMVCSHDGDIIGPCDCTSNELFAEARRLLDRWDALDLSDIVDDARPLIAALLERAERAAQLVSLRAEERAAFWDVAAERDAERAARERAEAEARQLREAIGDPDELIANAHYGRAANGHGDDLFATVSRIAAAVAEGGEDAEDTE